MPKRIRPKQFVIRETTLEDAERLIGLEQKIKQRDLELEKLALENEQLREKIKQSGEAAEQQRQMEREQFGFLRSLLNRLVWIFTGALIFTCGSLVLAALGIFALETSQKDILAGAILTEVGGLVLAAIGAFAGIRSKP